MKQFILAVACVIAMVPSVAAAQSLDCTPHYIYGMTGYSNEHWVPPNSAPIFDQLTNSGHVFGAAVPAGKIWVLRTASMSTNVAEWAEYMIEHLVNVPGGSHFHAIARMWSAGTPVVAAAPADLRADPLLPGERLGFRANIAIDGPHGVFGMWSGFEYPEACLPRVLGMEAPVVSGSGPATPPPDFSAAITALQSLGTAAQMLRESAVNAAQSLP